MWYTGAMENVEKDMMGSVQELSPKEELFEEYENLQIALLSEEDEEKREGIESRLNDLAGKLGITKEAA